MDTDDFPDDEDGMTACAVAESGSDGSPPPPEPSSEVGVSAIESLPEAEEPTIGDGGELCSPPLLPVSVLDEFVAEIAAAASTLALPADGEPIAAIEARINRGFALVSNLAHVTLRFAHAFGRLLIAYKHQVGHGNFDSRLEKYVLGPGRSRSTVGDCMRIASVPLEQIVEALNSQHSGNLSIRTALEYLRGCETDRPDGRRRSHQDRRVVSPRRPSTTAPRRDGAEDRPVVDEPVTREEAGHLAVDAPDAIHQTDAAATLQLDVSSVAFGESDGRSEDDAEDDPDDGSEHSSDSKIVANSSRAVAEPPTGPKRAGTPPEVFHIGGDEPVVTSLPSLEVPATAGVEKLTETAASPDAEGTPADEAWLAGLAIRSTLARTEAFDRDALTWRRLNPQIQELVERAALSNDERKRIRPQTWVARGFRSRLAYVASVRHPGEWLPCYRCHGQGTSVHGPQECSVCDGTCFEVTQIGDGNGSSTPSDDQGT